MSGTFWELILINSPIQLLRQTGSETVLRHKHKPQIFVHQLQYLLSYMHFSNNASFFWITPTPVFNILLMKFL